jgi:ubiquinone/menaquinone biosynthesis C-methylase UbiE
MKRLKNWDNKTWLSSNKYVISFNKFIKSKIKINKKINILDIGCGRGNIISLLQEKYNFDSPPVGIDIIRNKGIKKNIIFKKIDAIKYLKTKKKLFDLILIKQTIHFFPKKKLKTLLNLAKKKLNKNGNIMIFSLKIKDNEIPCFKLMKLNLDKSLKNDAILFKELKKNLKKINISYFYYKVNISKKIYVRMLQNKYISCLLTFSKKSITEGIAEINLKYRKTITFTDKLICIIYKK